MGSKGMKYVAVYKIKFTTLKKEHLHAQQKYKPQNLTNLKIINSNTPQF